MTDSFVEQVNEIDAVAVEDDVIEAYTSEDQFNALTVELLKEVGSFVCVASCILPADTKVWSRDKAIYGGLLVRLFKLISALLDQICQKRRETTFILSRLAFETIVNLVYLIQYGSPELFEQYIKYSLRQERRLHNRIMANIDARGGIRLPIEDRMLSSIAAAATKSGFPLQSCHQMNPSIGVKEAFMSGRKPLDSTLCISLPSEGARRASTEIGWTCLNTIWKKMATDSHLAWIGTDPDLKSALPSRKWQST